MADSDKEDKTESPSEKRINDSIEEGNLAHSRDVSIAVSLIASTAYLGFFGIEATSEIIAVIASPANAISNSSDLFGYEIKSFVGHIFIKIASLISPLLITLVIAGFLSSIIQNEPKIIVSRVQPKLSRISIKSGWKRLNSSNNYFDFLKSILKIVFVGSVFYFESKKMTQEILTMIRKDPDSAPAIIFSNVERLMIATSAVAAGIAVIDLVWQRRNWLNDLKMTKQEMKDEIKQSEGDPVVKSRLRSLGRSRARNRMMKAVPTATLIIANPTHIAIAMRYRRDLDAAPIIVAIGADLIAQRIRQVAADHSIPVFEQIELARSLYKVVRINQIIPQQFYKAIAILIREIDE